MIFGLLIAVSVSSSSAFALAAWHDHRRNPLQRSADAGFGFPTYRYKLIAFVLSAAMCSISGLLLANLTDFVTAQYMTWQRSGEILVMAILGGTASLFGPVVGATALLLFEEVFSGYTDHWAVVLGPIMVLIVIYMPKGLWGLLPEPKRPS